MAAPCAWLIVAATIWCVRLKWSFSPPPVSISAQEAEFLIELQRGAVAEVFIEIGAEEGGVPSPERFDRALQRLSVSMQKRLQEGAAISTSGRLFNEWIDRSRSDLGAVDNGAADGPISLRRHSMVRDPIRARRDHHVIADIVAESSGLPRACSAF